MKNTPIPNVFQLNIVSFIYETSWTLSFFNTSPIQLFFNDRPVTLIFIR